jgi:transcriptional regulator with XRE-family HTH domain
VIKESEGRRHKTVGYLLRRLREERGLSLRQLAREVGLDSAYLSRIERGLVPASDTALRALCAYFRAPEFYAAAGRLMPEDLRPLFAKDRLSDYMLRYQSLMSEFEALESRDADTFPPADPYAVYAEVAPRPLPEVYPADEEYSWRSGYEALGIPLEWIHLFPPLRAEVISRYLQLREQEGERARAGTEEGQMPDQEYLNASTAAAYSEGYIAGLLRANGIFRETLDRYGLFWVLAAFLPPQEARLLSDVHAALKAAGFSVEAQAAVRAYLQAYLKLLPPGGREGAGEDRGGSDQTGTR